MRSPDKAQIIGPSDRGFQYGDGLFETIAVRDGELRHWGSHLDRLTAGCERLGLEVSSDSLKREVEAELASSKQDTSFCIAKIIVTAGTLARGYGRSLPTPAKVYISVFSSTPLDRDAYTKGVATMLCTTRLATGSEVAGLKTLNRIEQVLASSECLPTDAFEGLTLDAAGRLICGTISNVFIVKDNVIRTPSLKRCGVEGTMRRFVLELLHQDGRDAEVCDLRDDDLASADEVFITNSQMGAVPVHCCDDYKWPVGSTTRGVMNMLADAGISECRV